MNRWTRFPSRLFWKLFGSELRECWESCVGRVDEIERRLDVLANGHAQFARGAQEHLAGLQAGFDRMGVTQRDLAVLRNAMAALEACLADLETSQGWVAAALARSGTDKFPE
jgi:hypothetical protein